MQSCVPSGHRIAITILSCANCISRISDRVTYAYGICSGSSTSKENSFVSAAIAESNSSDSSSNS